MEIPAIGFELLPADIITCPRSMRRRAAVAAVTRPSAVNDEVDELGDMALAPGRKDDVNATTFILL